MHQSGESTLCSGNSDPRISEVYKNKVTYVIRGACPLRVRCSSALKPLSSGAPIRREAPSYLDLCGSQQRGKMMWYAPVFNVLLGYSHFSGQSRSHNQPVSNGAGMYNPLSERGTEHGEQQRMQFPTVIGPERPGTVIKLYCALAGWFSGLERHPIHQKVAGLIPGQGTYRRQPINVSLSPTFSLKSVNISSGEGFKKCTLSGWQLKVGGPPQNLTAATADFLQVTFLQVQSWALVASSLHVSFLKSSPLPGIYSRL